MGLLVSTHLLAAVFWLSLGVIIERRANSKRFVTIDQAPDREPRR